MFKLQGKNCLTNLHEMNLTTDKLRSMVKMGQTLIEGNCGDVKVTWAGVLTPKSSVAEPEPEPPGLSRAFWQVPERNN